MFYLQPNWPLSLLNEHEISAPTDCSGAELAACLAGRISRPPGWAATCTISVENRKDGEQYFICLEQKETLGEPYFAVDCNCAAVHFTTFKREFSARCTKSGRHCFEELTSEALSDHPAQHFSNYQD